MRYKNIAPKYLYYLGLVVNMVLLSIVTMIYSIAINSGQIDFIIIFGIVASIFLFWVIRFFVKFIHVTIDLEKGRLIFGNIFFKQESNIADISQFEKATLSFGAYKIKISGTKYLTLIDQTQHGYLRELMDKIG